MHRNRQELSQPDTQAHRFPKPKTHKKHHDAKWLDLAGAFDCDQVDLVYPTCQILRFVVIWGSWNGDSDKNRLASITGHAGNANTSHSTPWLVTIVETRRSIASSGLGSELALHAHGPKYLIGQLDITFAREKARGSFNTICSVVFRRKSHLVCTSS